MSMVGRPGAGRALALASIAQIFHVVCAVRRRLFSRFFFFLLSTARRTRAYLPSRHPHKRHKRQRRRQFMSMVAHFYQFSPPENACALRQQRGRLRRRTNARRLCPAVLLLPTHLAKTQNATRCIAPHRTHAAPPRRAAPRWGGAARRTEGFAAPAPVSSRAVCTARM